MKNIIGLSLISLTLIFASCSSNENKAQKLIKQYLSENLNDASSYESVEFSGLDSLFSSYMSTPEGEELWKKGGMIGTFHERASELEIELITEKKPETIAIYEDSIKIYKQLATEYETKYNENEKAYKGNFTGWQMTHKYRAKNKLGATVLESTLFNLDKEFTKVTYTNK